MRSLLVLYLSVSDAEWRAPLKGMKKMNARAITNVTGRVLGRQETDILTRSLRRHTIGLLSFGSVGIFSGLMGLAINALFLFGFAEDKGPLASLGIWFLVAAFPLLFMTSHCLDKVDQARKAIKSEYWKNRGYEDSES